MDTSAILRKLRPAMMAVSDPLSGESVWLAGLVKDPRVEDGALRFTVQVTPRHTPIQRRALVDALVEALREGGVEVPIDPFVREGDAPQATVQAPEAPRAVLQDPVKLEGVRYVLAVASGKGGVGKSTVATNLAVALARKGLSVGLLDADVHGPSAPTMFGVTGRPMISPERRILPREAHGVRVLSMGLVADPEQPMIWRGPMVMGALRQFLEQGDWRGTDVLVVDLPPGTGDAQLTLVQSVPLAGAVVVTTPQEVALADAVRGLQMFRKVGVPVLGLVENMAYYALPDGTRDPVFGEGGGARLAAAYDSEVLVQLPLQTSIRAAGDAGQPIAAGTGPHADAFTQLADAVWARLDAASA